MKKIFLFSIIFLRFGFNIEAQSIGDYWYFGTNAGIHFPGPVALSDGEMDTAEGCATISDNSGNLLFYTDGTKVYNSLGLIVAWSLHGDPSSTQSAIITPRPTFPSQYYIITVAAWGDPIGINLYPVTVTATAPFVTVGQEMHLRNGPVAEKITAVCKGDNSGNFWLIAHSWDSLTDQTFYVWEITPSGPITPPSEQSVGAHHLPGIDRMAGYLKASQQGDKLALACIGLLNNNHDGFFDLFSFDNLNGNITHLHTFPINQGILPDQTRPYGIEFSPDGNYFYGSLLNGGSSIQYPNHKPGVYQFNTNAPYDVISVYEDGDFDDNFGALQLAPDGNIYAGRNLKNFLSSISNPNGPIPIWNETAVTLAENTHCHAGLPNFVQCLVLPSFSDCEKFDDGEHNFITYSDDNGNITNTIDNLVIEAPGSTTNPEDLGLKVTDISGGTFVYNSSDDYSGNYHTSSKHCLCWDMNVLQNSGLSYFPSILIYREFNPYIPRSATNPKYLAEFTSNSPTGLNVWVRSCAPMKIKYTTVFPQSNDGVWTWLNNSTSMDWNTFISDIDGIMFRVDILGGGGNEIFRLDNICFECQTIPLPIDIDVGLPVINPTGALPISQPFNQPPWNYPGTEIAPTIPPNAVDWGLIEIRDAPDAASANTSTTFGRRAAFLMSDHNVRDIDGISLLTFDALPVENNLYVVVRNRNHLDIMSSAGLTLIDGKYTYDFTDAMSKAYGGSLGYMQISASPPLFGMVPGDGNADGIVDINDLYPIWPYHAGKQGYLPPDYNLDGQVDNRDKNDMWLPSLGKSSQVP